MRCSVVLGRDYVLCTVHMCSPTKIAGMAKQISDPFYLGQPEHVQRSPCCSKIAYGRPRHSGCGRVSMANYCMHRTHHMSVLRAEQGPQARSTQPPPWCRDCTAKHGRCVPVSLSSCKQGSGTSGGSASPAVTKWWCGWHCCQRGRIQHLAQGALRRDVVGHGGRVFYCVHWRCDLTSTRPGRVEMEPRPGLGRMHHGRRCQPGTCQWPFETRTVQTADCNQGRGKSSYEQDSPTGRRRAIQYARATRQPPSAGRCC